LYLCLNVSVWQVKTFTNTMSNGVHIFFGFSEGIKRDIFVPKHKLDFVKQTVEDQMDALGIEEIPEGFYLESHALKAIGDDDDLCEFASEQNDLVETAYLMVEAATAESTADNTELLTQECFKSILPMLKEVTVPIDRWSKQYHKEQMTKVFEILRGEKIKKVIWDIPALSVEQAAGVVWLIDVVLGVDRHQNDLAVCKGEEFLSSGDEYFWCENCGAVDYEDTHDNKDGESACDHCHSDDEEE